MYIENKIFTGKYLHLSGKIDAGELTGNRRDYKFKNTIQKRRKYIFLVLFELTYNIVLV